MGAEVSEGRGQSVARVGFFVDVSMPILGEFYSYSYFTRHRDGSRGGGFGGSSPLPPN